MRTSVCSKAVVTAACRLDSSYSVEGQLPVPGAVELIECEDEAERGDVAVIERLSHSDADGQPDVEGAISPGRCAVLGRNRFVFGAY